MKTFKNTCAQGDVYIRRIGEIPKTAAPVQANANGHYVVAHSETGHDHIVRARPGIQMYTTDDPMVSYLQIIEATEATEALLEHLRGHDTHESIKLAPGNYEMRRQREHTPEGWRRVAD